MSADARGLEFEFVQPGEALAQAVRAPEPGPATARPRVPRRASRRFRFTRRLRSLRAVPLAIAFLSALVFVAATDGGSLTRQPTPVIPHLDQLLERLGLGLSEIVVTGQQMVSDRDIYDRLALTGTRSIWMVDTDAARRGLEELGWVRTASLKRVFPDRLVVEIAEWPPFAIWRDGTRAVALAETGRILGPVDPAAFAKLPVVYGVAAGEPAPAIIAAVRALPALAPRVALYERVAERRWTLHLNSGRRIHLPARGQSRALLMLVDGAPGARLMDLDFDVLDLRLPDRPAVSMREARR